MRVSTGIGVRTTTPNFQSRLAQSAMTTALKIIMPHRPATPPVYIDDGTATVWEINDAYRTSGCRVGGHGIYHDHAFCARLPAAEAPAPEVAPSYPYLASYAVFLLSFATVRLLSSCTRRRETNHEQ